MLEIKLGGLPFKLPENWEDVVALENGKDKIPELLKYIYVLPESGSTYHSILRVVLGYSHKKWKRLMIQFFGKKCTDANREASAEALANVLGVLSWMWKTDLLQRPFESIKVKSKDWLLFESGFKTMSFGELTDAFIHAQAFVKQIVEGEERLNLLVATVCRPERQGNYRTFSAWNGDEREDYNEHISIWRSKFLEDQLLSEKIIILVYFLSNVKEFFSFFDLFSDDGTSPPVPEEYPGQSLIKNQHLLSGKGIFGGMAATQKANVHEVFTFLEEHHKDVKDEIARQKAANQN